MNDTIEKKKILIFIPAYNVEKQILRVLKRIPIEILKKYFIRILIIEDFSKDNTKQVIEDYIKTSENNKLMHLIKNEKIMVMEVYKKLLSIML